MVRSRRTGRGAAAASESVDDGENAPNSPQVAGSPSPAASKVFVAPLQTPSKSGGRKEFRVPIHGDDLLSEGSAFFRAEEPETALQNLSPAQQNKLLQEARARLGLTRGAPNHPAAMAVPNGLAFDEDRSAYNNLFTLLRGFHHLEDDLRNSLLSALHDAALASVRCAEAVLTSGADGGRSPGASAHTGATSSEIAVTRSGLKISTFFLQWCYTQASVNKAKGKAKPKKSTAGKRGARKRANDGDDDESDSINGSSLSWELESSQERILATLTQILELNLPVLWQANAPEEDFTGLMAKMSHTLLSHPTLCRSVVIRRALGGVLALLVNNYEYPATAPLIQDVLKFEHLCATGVGSGDTHVVADIVVSMATEHDCDSILSNILREIGKTDAHDFTTQGAKNISTFLAAITAAVPQRVLSHAAVLLPHLGDESHIMRNGIVDVVGHLLSYVNQPTPENDGNGEKNITDETRESLFATLEERFLDAKPFTRSRVCQTWARLFTEKSIKVERILRVMHGAVSRLNDTASHTRRNAIQLIKTMVEYNPFGPSLALSYWTAKYNTLESSATQRQAEVAAVVEALKAQAQEEGADREAIQEELSAKGVENKDAEDKEIFFLTYYKIVIEFVQLLQDSAIPKCVALLRSSTVTDVLEAISFFGVCHTFGVEAADKGMHRALALVWRDEPVIRDRMLLCFSEVLLVPRGGFKGPAPWASSDGQLTHTDALSIATQLVDFINSGLTIGDQASFEQLLGLYIRAEKERQSSGSALKSGQYFIPAAVVTALWEVFSTGGKYGCSGHGEEDAEAEAPVSEAESKHMALRARGALAVIAALAIEDADIIKSRLRLLVKHAFAKSGNQRTASNLSVARSACVCLGRMAKTDDFRRLPHEHALFQRFLVPRALPASFRRHGIAESDDFLDFCSFGEQCIDTVYALANRPDIICTFLIKKWISHLFPNALDGDYSVENVDPRELAVFFFFVGHIALKQVVHAEIVQTDLRKLRHLAEHAVRTEQVDEVDDELEAIEKELGVHEAAAEQEQEQVQQTAELEIVSFSNLLGRIVPLLQNVLEDFEGLFGGSGAASGKEKGKHTRTILRESAALALSKICCVDETFCGQNLQLLFSVLDCSESKKASEADYAFESSVRSNVVIALGDLSFRFPNLVEPWQPQMYAALLDEDAGVRKNALLVLSHLLLNEMVKPKGSLIATVAQCLNDPDQRIKDQAHLFFFELAQKTGGAAAQMTGGAAAPGARGANSKKGSGSGPQSSAVSANALRGTGAAIYNLLPDLLSTLCTDKRLKACTDDRQFKSIMQFLFSLLGREKQTEVLTERMCQRIAAATKEGNPNQQKRMTFCLASLKHTDKSLRRLWEFRGCLAGAVRESEEVAESLDSLVAKSRTSTVLRDALKITEPTDSVELPLGRLLDLLEAKVEQWRSGGDLGELEQAELDRLSQLETEDELVLGAAPTPSRAKGRAAPKRGGRAAPKRAPRRRPAKRNEWSEEESESESDSSSESESEPEAESSSESSSDEETKSKPAPKPKAKKATAKKATAKKATAKRAAVKRSDSRPKRSAPKRRS